MIFFFFFSLTNISALEVMNLTEREEKIKFKYSGLCISELQKKKNAILYDHHKSGSFSSFSCSSSSYKCVHASIITVVVVFNHALMNITMLPNSHFWCPPYMVDQCLRCPFVHGVQEMQVNSSRLIAVFLRFLLNFIVVLVF